MDGLAAYIKSLGLTPGIWRAPHGQKNEAVVRSNPGVFLLKPDGASASETWEVKFLVDPSAPGSHRYLKDLFKKLAGWGYEYFKIDGQPVVVGEYRRKQEFMKRPGDADEQYRETLRSIREAIGPDRYLLGCWGVPVEGVGIMDGSRTGGDVVLDWEGGFMLALRATMRNYYTHNVAWYADPDVMIVRSPLTLEQARAWATLQGLTGQALMATDRLTDLAGERVELLRRVYPAVDVRPLDLFPSERNKRILDLKVSHLGRGYDVVGVFNYDGARAEQVYLSWKDLGLGAGVPVHVYDFWNKEYLGAWEEGMAVTLPPTSTRVLTLLPAADRVQLISTSRHITQGWVDLTELRQDAAANSFSGESRVVRGDPYELRFVFPRGKNFAITKAAARPAGARGAAKSLPVKVTNHQGWATAEFTSPRTAAVSWEVRFAPAESYRYPPREPARLWAERLGAEGVVLRWSPQYYLNAGYQVYLNGSLVGYAPTDSFPLRGLDPEAEYTAEVRSVWGDGTASEKKAELKFTLKALLPAEVQLSELEPSAPAGRARGLELNRAVSGLPLSIAGRRYESGIGTRPGSEIEYDLRGLYHALSGAAGVDDGTGNQNAVAEFVVVGDGKELWRSGALKKSDAARPFRVDLTGIRRLSLRVVGGEATGPAAGPGGTQADWVVLRLSVRDGAGTR
jgi:hypothetical protein